MLWVKLGTQIIDHPRFLELSPQARDLWSWGMLYSGRHELDGVLPMAAVMGSAWGHGTRRNVHLANTLVKAGLWERVDSGYLVLRWAEQGNATKAEIAAGREATKARVSRHRNGVTNGVSNAFVPTSTSLSSSGSGSLSSLASPSAEMPAWFDAACESAAMAVGGEVGERPARWAEYLASRTRKSWAPGHTDAVGWLSTVVRSERAKASGRPAARGAEITKQGFDPEAPWMKLPEVG